MMDEIKKLGMEIALGQKLIAKIHLKKYEEAGQILESIKDQARREERIKMIQFLESIQYYIAHLHPVSEMVSKKIEELKEDLLMRKGSELYCQTCGYKR